MRTTELNCPTFIPQKYFWRKFFFSRLVNIYVPSYFLLIYPFILYPKLMYIFVLIRAQKIKLDINYSKESMLTQLIVVGTLYNLLIHTFHLSHLSDHHKLNWNFKSSRVRLPIN